MLKIVCPKCAQAMQADDNAAGRVIACPKCGQQMRLPAPAVATPIAPPAPVPPPVPPRAAPAAPPASASPFSGLGNDPVAEAPSVETEATFAEMTRSAVEEEETARLDALWRAIPQPLPAEVERLGTPRVIYHTQGKGTLLLKVLGTAAGIALFLMAVALKGVKSQEVAKGLLTFSAFVFTIAAVLLLIVVLAGQSFRLIFFDDALVFNDGRRFTVYRLEHVEYVRHNTTRVFDQNGFLLRVVHDVRIRFENKPELRFNNRLQGVERLSARVTHEAIRVQLPQALDELRRGETIWLGEFGISAEGLSHNGVQVPWVALETCTIHKATLIFRRRFEVDIWLEVPASDVPRSFLLVALADVLMRGRAL